MDYGTFSLIVSVADVVVYTVLMTASVRRERWLRRHPIHERELLITESPTLLVLLMVSLLLLLTSLTIGRSDYVEAMRLAAGVIRGVVLALGLWLFGWYLTVRETWL